MKRLAYLVSVIAMGAAACGGGDGGADDTTPPGPPMPPIPDENCTTAPAPAPEPLQWKRMAALHNDIVNALVLEPAQVCNELGRYPCALVHIVSLGSANPFGSSLYEAMAEPLATTPSTLDRLVLAACSQRVDLDRQGPAQVFTQFDLNAAAPAPGSPAARALVVDMYRRFLQRDATEEEILAVTELAVDGQGQPVSARDFAKLSCFAVATTTEFFLF